MRRRDEGDRGPVPRQGPGVEALGVDAARDELDAFPGQQSAQGRLAGILEHGASVARLRGAGPPRASQQGPRYEAEGLRATGGDEHFIRRGAQAFGAVEIGGRLLAQAAHARAFAVAQGRGGKPSRRLGEGACPCLPRELVQRGHPGPEVHGRRVAKLRHRARGYTFNKGFPLALPLPNVRLESAAGNRSSGRRGGNCSAGADVAAGSSNAFDVALRLELLEGLEHQSPGNSELAGQLAAGGKARAASELAREYPRPELVGELASQAPRERSVQDDSQHVSSKWPTEKSQYWLF